MRWNDHPPTNQHQLPSTRKVHTFVRRIEYIKMCFFFSCAYLIQENRSGLILRAKRWKKETMKKHMLIPTLHPTYYLPSHYINCFHFSSNFSIAQLPVASFFLLLTHTYQILIKDIVKKEG